MKNSLFDNTEIEGYTNPSRIKFWTLALAVYAGAVFVGWMMNAGAWLPELMDAYAESEVIKVIE